MREVLDELGDGAKSAQARFNISAAEWGWFGKILNNYDLRHSPKAIEALDLAAPPTSGDIETVKQMGAAWITRFLTTTGVTLV